MRLLKRHGNGAFGFTHIFYDKPPPYAILSHTWLSTEGAEVLFQDIIDGSASNKTESFAKITFIAEQARKEGIDYFWVDNCCIDKRNHSELSAAIMSMYRWYEESEICFVYLTDVQISQRNLDGSAEWDGSFRNCRWFKRGWTLQELLAPARVEFFAHDLYLGDRSSLSQEIHKITGIRVDALMGTSPKDIPIATRLRWAASRRTTVPEDEAYCMMGLCGVRIMPMYGETLAIAKQRLDEEIRKTYGNACVDLASTWSEQKSAESLQHNQSEARKAKLDMLQFDRMDSRKTDIEKAHKYTCDWVLENTKVLKWKDAHATKQHLGFLWIKGHPGAGKSVLMKHLEADTVRTKCPRDICISFYFYARGEELEKSLEGMYRSLLTQLLRSNEDLQIILDHFGPNAGSRTMLGRLRTLLSAAVKKLDDRRLFCFIDALDECNAEDMQDTIDFFRGLCEEAMEMGAQVYICFASRYYPTLDIPTGLQLELDSIDEHDQDLSKYVRSQRFALGSQGKSTSIPVQVQREILNKANGVFLWVVLVVDILKKEYLKGRLHAVKARLQELPADLKDLFQNIVQRDQENIDEFILCLTWILYAQRPLSLKEFYFARLADSEEYSLEWDDQTDDDAMHNFLRSSTKGLAELSKGKDRRAQFIHESVRDFLLKADGLRHVDPNHNASTSQAHERLKQCCIRGIQMTGRSYSRIMKFGDCFDYPTQLRSSLRRGVRLGLNQSFPFLDYAIQNIFYHCDQAATEVSQWGFIDGFDMKDWGTKANLLQQHQINAYAEDTTLSYIFAQKNCANLIGLLAERNARLNSPSKNRNNFPLVAAIANRSMEAACALLHHSGVVDPHEIVKDLVVNNYKGLAAYDMPYRGSTDWLWALDQGSERLATHFFRPYGDWSLDELALNYVWRNAVSHKNSAKLTQILCFLKSKNALNGFCHKILADAAEASSTDSVKMMLEVRAADDPRYPIEDYVLSNASRDGAVDIVGMLLEQGCDANARNGEGDTALMNASISGHTDVVRLLLRNKANVNGPGGRYGSALQAASFSAWSDSVVKVLLEHGADANADLGDNGTALQIATSRNNMQAVKLLLDGGADVNWRGRLGQAALLIAIAKGHTAIVELLQLHSNRSA